MSRFRAMFVTTGLFLLAAAVAINGWAQGPGGGGRGGRGGGGPGGGGPGGGFVGPGGRGMGGPGGDSLLSLALRPPVQEDLKATDKQKTQLNSLNEDFNQRRQKLMDSMRQNGNGNGGGRNRNNNNNNNNNNNGGNGNNSANATIGNFGRNVPTTPYEINPYALNVNQQPNQQAQDPQQDDRQARFQAMRESMTELDQQANTTLARILSSKQFQRLNQIQIQLQGINALVRPEVAEKVQLDETQVEAIQAVINDRRTAQREVFSKQGNLFRSFRNQNGGGGANAKNQNQAGAAATGDATAKRNGAAAAANGGQANAAGAADNGGQANTKGAGGNGRRGGPGGFDREAMKKFMEQPEVKAQIDQTQAETAKLDSRATQAAYQIMTKYQVAAFKKLQGPPFDVAQLRPNFGGPGGNRNGAAAAAPAAKSASSSTPEKAEATKDTASTTADSKKATTSKAKSKAKSSTKKRSNTHRATPSDDDPGVMDIPTDFDQN